MHSRRKKSVVYNKSESKKEKRAVVACRPEMEKHKETIQVQDAKNEPSNT